MLSVHMKRYLQASTSSEILDVRMRLFNTYITTIFMYNSELWTLTKHRELEIDRCISKKTPTEAIKDPYKMSNEDFHERTDEENWLSKIEARTLAKIR